MELGAFILAATHAANLALRTTEFPLRTSSRMTEVASNPKRPTTFIRLQSFHMPSRKRAAAERRSSRPTAERRLSRLGAERRSSRVVSSSGAFGTSKKRRQPINLEQVRTIDEEDDADLEVYMQNENRGETADLVERKPVGLLSKMRYWRDKHIAKSGNVVWLLLFAALAQTILAACAFYIVVNLVKGEENSVANLLEGETSFAAILWVGWQVMTDPGAMGAATGIARPVAAVFGMCGIFFFAVVLGFIVDAIRENLVSGVISP
jgi:hypothetical protein